MADLPWLRLYSDAVDNEKLRLLAFEDRWHFIAILCCKRQGIIDKGGDLLDRKLAVKLGVQLSVLDEIKRRLIEVNLITKNWQPIGWDDHQFKSDCDTTSAARQKKYRDARKKERINNDVPLRNALRNELVTRIDTDTDTDTDTDILSIDKINMSFSQFYDAYPKKVKRVEAEKVWAKLKQKDIEEIAKDLPDRIARSWQHIDKNFIPAPDVYLRNKRWQDDIISFSGNKKQSGNFVMTTEAIYADF